MRRQDARSRDQFGRNPNYVVEIRHVTERSAEGGG